MTKTEAIAYFGSQARIAEVLGIGPPAVSLWPDRLPAMRQYQLERASGGALKVDADLDVSAVRRTEAA